MVKQTKICGRGSEPGEEAERDQLSHIIIASAPRLLKQADAARYCSMSVPMFKRECPVQPLKFGVRDLRYDLRAIDKWIDAKSAPCSIGSSKHWLQRLDDAHAD